MYIILGSDGQNMMTLARSHTTPVYRNQFNMCLDVLETLFISEISVKYQTFSNKEKMSL